MKLTKKEKTSATPDQSCMTDVQKNIQVFNFA